MFSVPPSVVPNRRDSSEETYTSVEHGPGNFFRHDPNLTNISAVVGMMYGFFHSLIAGFCIMQVNVLE